MIAILMATYQQEKPFEHHQRDSSALRRVENERLLMTLAERIARGFES